MYQEDCSLWASDCRLFSLPVRRVSLVDLWRTDIAGGCWYRERLSQFQHWRNRVFCTVFRSDLVRYIPGFSWSSIKSRYRVRISWADNLVILSSTKHNPRNHMASRNKAFIKQLLKHIWYTKLHVLLIWSFTLNIKSLAIFSRRFLHIYIKNVKICDMYTTDFTFSIRSWHPLQSTLSIYCTTEWFPFNIFGLCW